MKADLNMRLKSIIRKVQDLCKQNDLEVQHVSPERRSSYDILIKNYEV